MDKKYLLLKKEYIEDKAVYIVIADTDHLGQLVGTKLRAVEKEEHRLGDYTIVKRIEYKVVEQLDD